MSIISQSVPGEITLMFVSYLLFCTVLMYLFVKTDREWGQLEESLDDTSVTPHAAPGAMAFAGASARVEPVYSDIALRQSLRHCAAHDQAACSCFVHGQGTVQG